MSKQEIRRIYRTALKEDFPQVLRLELGGEVFEYSKVHWTIGGENRGLRYGTNPHQKAALYRAEHSRGGTGNVEWIKWGKDGPSRSEEHTSELQSQSNLVCRLLLEKKKHNN